MPHAKPLFAAELSHSTSPENHSDEAKAGSIAPSAVNADNALRRSSRDPLQFCVGSVDYTDSETRKRVMIAFEPLVEALSMVKARFYAEATFDAAGRLLVPFAVDDLAQICWALSLAEFEPPED